LVLLAAYSHLFRCFGLRKPFVSAYQPQKLAEGLTVPHFRTFIDSL